MKNKSIMIILAAALLFTACGSTANPSSDPSSSTTITESSEVEPSVEVERELFDVTITIPADFVGEQTQEDLDKISQEKGYQSITLNADGSATYVMTRTQHEELLAEYRQQLTDTLNEMVGSEDYPNFTSIVANDNFTEFTVTTKSTELDMNESFSVIAFYMYGGLYNVFSGVYVDNVHVDFINADTGEIIDSSDSSDMGN